MSPVRIVAAGAVSGLGLGPSAFNPLAETAVAPDSTLAGLGLRKPNVARALLTAAASDLGEAGTAWADPAARLLDIAAGQLVRELEGKLGDWRSRRVVVVVGTSSGGMHSQTAAFDRIARGSTLSPELCRMAPYFGPLEALASHFPGARVINVLAACASSGLALGLGMRLLQAGHAELVIAGGYDAVTGFVAAGFEALGATTRSTPKPFSLARDGLALGEGAALVALELASAETAGPWLLGFSATSDAEHATAPSRTGAGLERAARLALSRADANALSALAQAPHARGLEARLAFDLISAHGTATLANDRTEAVLIARLRADCPADVHAFKGQLGHTLGAGSLLELLAALRALELGIRPELQHPPHEPGLEGNGLAPGERGPGGRVLKLASAFGGCNVALVAGLRADAPSTEVVTASGGVAGAVSGRPVSVAKVGEPWLAPDLERVAAHARIERLHTLRLDVFSGLCATAALEVLPPSADAEAEHVQAEEAATQLVVARQRTGVVVATTAATIEHNAAFQSRLRARGYSSAEARRFPATSPNLAAGMVSILFGLGGPSLSVGAGVGAAFEGLLVALELIAAGDADEMLLIVCDQVGTHVEQLFETAGFPLPARGALAVRLCAAGKDDSSSLLRFRADILARVTATQEPPGGPRAQASPFDRASGDECGWPELQRWLVTLGSGCAPSRDK